MATLNFIRIDSETDKSVKIITRESGYDLENLREIKQVSHWIPKSVLKIEGNIAIVADWFFNKNISVDTYGAFMKSLANS